MLSKISTPSKNIYANKTLTVSVLDRYVYIIQGCIPTPLKLVPSKINGRTSFKLTTQELKNLQNTLQGLRIPPHNILRWK